MAIIRHKEKGQAKVEVADRIIGEAGQHFFGARFVKKDGSDRSGQFRLHVGKHTRGGKLKYNPKEHNLRGVWEANNKEGCVEEQAYRMISLETVTMLKVNGDEHIFE
jgi:hypothetical protein